MEIIRERQLVTVIDYEKIYIWKFDHHRGFSFPCDQDENVADLCPDAQKNYDLCQNNSNIIYCGVRKYQHTYCENAMGKCSCGAEVELYNQYCGACQCPECGQWYNLFGQELLPPDEWEELIDEE